MKDTDDVLKRKPREEWEWLIYQWIFDERDRDIITRKLLDGIKFEPLAEEFKLSVTQVKKIVKRTKSVLFEHV